MQWSARSPLPRREVPYAVRLLIAAAIAGGTVWWLLGQSPPTYDLRLLQRCLVAQGIPARRTAPRTLTAHGKVVVRLRSDGRVASHGEDLRIRSCLDRVAGRHLRLRK